MKHDIVYILRKDIDPYELTYSLRSVAKNFPHRKVWFVGGKPKGLTPDVMLEHEQSGSSKWDLIRSSMWKVIHEDDLTDDFFLFNDDFFIMKPVKGKFTNFVDKSLDWRIEDLRKVNPWLNPYGRTMYKMNEELKCLGIREPKNFEVHMPMLMNKELAKASIYKVSSPQMRSAYGNINSIKTIQHDDVKVYDLETVPEDPDYLSTSERIFADGAVGRYIRGAFPEPSRFEDTRGGHSAEDTPGASN